MSLGAQAGTQARPPFVTPPFFNPPPTALKGGGDPHPNIKGRRANVFVNIGQRKGYPGHDLEPFKVIPELSHHASYNGVGCTGSIYFCCRRLSQVRCRRFYCRETDQINIRPPLKNQLSTCCFSNTGKRKPDKV